MIVGNEADIEPVKLWRGLPLRAAGVQVYALDNLVMFNLEALNGDVFSVCPFLPEEAVALAYDILETLRELKESQ